MDKLLKYKTRHLNIEFSQILETEAINMVFQPIVHLATGRILGYEALCRGPIQSPLHFPDLLFEMAKHNNKVSSLDELARKKAIEKFLPYGENYKLFINMTPITLKGYDFFSSSTFKCLEDNKVNPENIVLEITEQAPIDKVENFEAILNDIRSLGIKIALDDVGSGYSGLKTILKVMPDYIKIDMDLTRNIHKDNMRRNLVKGLINMCRDCNMKIIVEGIECKEELETLMDLGAYGGQGYFLQKPVDSPEDISTECKGVLKNYLNEKTDYRK